ncbi:MAG: hypothetical protein QOF76_4277 [Solirubrobacteraceae bacterium]|jgi:AcrR family transcriptional regulator|nr:hypothetical protein [Solirubrobacteraceae bacterium]
MSEDQRSYAGETGDERAARRRAALLDAAFDSVARDGWRGLRIAGLCQAAGLNKRYFYESFPDLDALIGALMHRIADDAITVTLAVVDPDAPDEAAFVLGPIRTFVEHLTEDPRRARVLFGAVAPDDAAAEHRVAAIREIVSVVAAQGRRRHHLEDGALVELVASMLVGGTSQAVLDWLDGRIDSSRDAFAQQLATLWQTIGEAHVRASA